MSLTQIYALPIPNEEIIIEYARKIGLKRKWSEELLSEGERDLAIKTGIKGLGLRFRYGDREKYVDIIPYLFCGYPSEPERLPSHEQVERLAGMLGIENEYGVYEVEPF